MFTLLMYIPSSSNLIRVQSYQQTVNCERALHKIDVVLLIKIMGNSLKKNVLECWPPLKQIILYNALLDSPRPHPHQSIQRKRKELKKK